MHDHSGTNVDPKRADNHAAKWYAVYTGTHQEKHVSLQFSQREVESFLPTYKKRCQWKKRAVTTVELPLFANYVFVRVTRNQRVAVLSTPGVISIVGAGQDAWELPDEEIKALRLGVQHRRVEPHDYLVVGERARVKSGMLEGLEGVVIRKKSDLHIILTLDQIMRSVAIEVSADELEPLKCNSVKSQHAFDTASRWAS